MTKARKIELFYGIFLSILTVVVGILFVVEAADVYYSDGYSREEVGRRLGYLMIPVCLWLAACVGGFVLSVVFAANRTKRVQKDLRKNLQKLEGRLDKSDSPQWQSYKKWEHIRLGGYLFGVMFGVVAAIFCCAYLFNTQHFAAQDINGEVLKMLKNVLPWVVSAFIVAVAAFVLDLCCAKKQLPLAKDMIAGGLVQSGGIAEKHLSASQPSARSTWILRGIVLAFAVAFIVVGIVNGGAGDVLKKAINICTECIGLG